MTNCRFRCKHRPSIPLTFPLLWGLTSACWLKSWPLLKLFSHSQQSKLWAAKWNRPANIVHSKCSDYLNWCLSVFASSRSHLFLFVPDVTLLYMLSGCRREQWTTKAFVRSPAQWRMYSKTRLSVSKSNQKFCLSVFHRYNLKLLLQSLTLIFIHSLHNLSSIKSMAFSDESKATKEWFNVLSKAWRSWEERPHCRATFKHIIFRQINHIQFVNVHLYVLRCFNNIKHKCIKCILWIGYTVQGITENKVVTLSWSALAILHQTMHSHLKTKQSRVFLSLTGVFYLKRQRKEHFTALLD